MKKASVFTVPGLCRFKTRKEVATCRREMFGVMVLVSAWPAR